MSLEIIPSIDLRSGRVVRLQQGDYARQLDYEVDAESVAKAYAAAGASWLHVVDLDGAKQGGVVQQREIAGLIRRVGMNVQVGGGVRSEADIDRLLEAGAVRVVVGTAAMENWKWFKNLVHEPMYSGKLVLAVDARDGVIATRGWTASSGRKAVDVAREVSNWPLGALLYTDIARDGMLSGPNFTHTAELAEACDLPVIASGGVGVLEHIRQARLCGAWGIIVGRALYDGAFSLAEALQAARN